VTNASLQTENHLDSKLLTTPYSPASTFKIVIAWVGLEENVISQDTEILCHDKHVEGTPRKLKLRDALYYSSNDYFVEVVKLIGREKFIPYVNRSGFLQTKVSTDWLKNNLQDVAHAGNEKVSAAHLQQWMEQFASNGLSVNPDINQRLMNSLFWGTYDQNRFTLSGKTGTAYGAARFVSIMDAGKKRYVITSLVPYDPTKNEAMTARGKAISLVEKKAAELMKSK